MKNIRTSLWISAALIGLVGFDAAPAVADQVFLDDVIVDGSLCVGIDCVNGESFGFDTIRLKENNLRIKFQDTSTSASFPSNDWQLTANDSANGGANKFSIDDIDGGRTPFTIEAGAPSHSLFVDDGGRIGLGTSTPVVEVHIVDGDTPTLRLEQDGSSGFTPQIWDVAGNETNFFIRDVTNGSTLPFRIQPGAPTSALYIDSAGEVGIGDTTPDVALDINDSGGRVSIEMTDTTSGDSWQIVMDDDADLNAGLSFTRAGTGMREFRIDPTGNLFVNGAAHTVPDYVFEPDYELMPLEELAAFVEENKHLPKVQSAAEVKAQGLNMTGMQLRLLEKVEELTLYTIAQQEQIAALRQKLEGLDASTVGQRR